MSILGEKIKYEKLKARQKETYNFQKKCTNVPMNSQNITMTSQVWETCEV